MKRKKNFYDKIYSLKRLIYDEKKESSYFFTEKERASM
jgi:hypothetical protein